MGKMTNCKSCGKEIAINAKTCPSCGAKNKKPFYKKIWFWVIVVIIAIALVSGGGSNESSSSDNKPSNNNDNNNSPAKTDSTKKEKFSYTIESAYVGDYNMGYYIEGIVTNNTDKEYSYVQIEFVCYDSAGNNLGTALDNTNHLLGNQTWKYKAVFLDTDGSSVDHCDYHEITSW